MADIANKKKTGRKLKRSVRKTMGALFLASAIVVAAIPTDGLRAAETNSGVMPLAESNYESSNPALKWTQNNSKIPLVNEDEKNIYTDADGIFNFAWVNESETSANRVAVILGYTGKTLDNNELVIDGTVDAYAKYQSNDSSNGGYVAVSQSREPLYYMSVERKVDKTHIEEEKDTDGNVISKTEVIDSYTIPSFSPCVKEDANWDRKGSMETYYYYRYNGTRDEYETKHPSTSAEALIKDDTTSSSILTSSGAFLGSDGYVYIQTKETEHQWIRNQTVAYIGNQYLVQYEDKDATSTNGSTVLQEYKVAEKKANTDPTKGIFAYQSNIQRLTVGKDLIGIGNYAFYNCALLNYVKFGNGLQEVGHSAFELCTNMYGVGFDFGSNLSYISDRAFAQSGLQTFTLPVGVTQIYDHAFDGCINLTSIDLTGETQEPVWNEETQKWVQPRTTLNQLGCSVFKNCTSLTEIKFPQTMSMPVHLDNFENCKLKHILVMDNQASFVPHDATDTIKKFKEQIAEEFYFEGADSSRTHDFARENGIAFKYSDQDLFELVVIEEDDNGVIQSKVRYQIIPEANGEGNLSNFMIMQGTVKNVEIPEKIGPYGISALNEGSFSGNCSLERITIPASVRRINTNAFRGCHNLTHVIFTAAENITTIGNNAFATQQVTSHSQGCNGSITNSPQLMFVGTVSYQCEPFDYAMRPESNINREGQPLTYITYCSGWPTHLEVCYNPKTDKNELINYPTKTRITNGEYTVTKYPYMTDEQAQSMTTAMNHIGATDVPEGEQKVIDAVTHIVLPSGIESIKEELFVESEKTEQLDKTITAQSLVKVEEGAFRGCKNLVGLTLSDATKEIGNYAFEDCSKLSAVTLPGTVDTMGLRPFKGCSRLTNVNFSGGPYFTCENGIVYGLDAGAKSSVVECLEGRTNPLVTGAELAGVTELYPEAFMGTGVVNVDLSRSSVSEVPEYSFAYTPSLSAVTLPDTVRGIRANAFKNSKIQILTVPGQFQNINKDAFGDDDYSDPDDCHTAGGLTSMNGLPGKTNLALMQCEKGSMAEGFAKDNPDLIAEYTNELDIFYTVNFYDWNDNFLETQSVKKGEAAVPPTPPEIEGYTFIGWKPVTWASVTEDIPFCQAQYEKNDVVKHTVTFIDWNDEVYATREVEHGKDLDVLMPPNPVRAGYVFKGWKGNLSGIVKDEVVYAYYESDSTKHLVSFVDPMTNTVLSTQNVDHGTDVITPPDPVKEGYTFMGWIGTMTNIIRDETVYANFVSNDQAIPKHTVTFVDDDENNTVLYTQTVDDGRDAVIPQSPVKEGYTFKGWKGNLKNITRDETIYATYEKNANGNGTNPGGTNPGGTTPGGTTPGGTNPGAMYVLTVQNGSGSGNYQEGAQPVIIANDPASGQEFSHWTIDPAGTKLASAVLSASVVTMPAANVTVTAHYKAKTVVSTGTGNSSSGNSNRPSGNTGIVSNGTTVVIDKNGLSNTGVVSATVKGSSDNFTIKITEDSAATEAVLRALMAEYGSDLSRIKYFPMDISLYDASGTRKITDTQGLLINITLPLPDSLIPYAGNNKVAGVVNDRLDRLGCKFTTIDGVSCVTFTAEHFSPYVIYVDTGNLIEGMVNDTTPKTGDGIHPKWFLSIGLACMSMVMFMQKDNRKKKVKVKVRA